MVVNVDLFKGGKNNFSHNYSSFYAFLFLNYLNSLFPCVIMEFTR